MTPLPASRAGSAPRPGARWARWARYGLALAAVGTVAAAAFFWPADPPMPLQVSQGAPVPIEPVGTSRPGASDPAAGSADAGPSASPPAAASVAADRYRLVGVMASAGAGRGTAAGGSDGVALIAVDGGPARPFPVGATVDGDTVLLDVSATGATLGARDRSQAFSIGVAPAPAQAAVAIPDNAPVPVAPAQDPADEAPTMSAEVWRQTGSRHPPLKQPVPVAPTPGEDGQADVDDGRWVAPAPQ